ncbi:hypothetical protein VTN00DRAFT_8662 [Thermoascus crustaceus]|uniref:uncharacterized protein n=1 Tax=Thermoascus crustaceus TaxID=5088 RepID=UPI0037427DE5
MRDIDAEDDPDSDDSDSGLNPRESPPTPIPMDRFPPGTKIVQVAAGVSTTFVLTDEGLVYGWGTFRDDNGVFGFSLRPNNEIIHIQKEPMLIQNLQRITDLSAGNDFCLALDAEGNIFGWGNGDQSQLGHRLIGRRRSAALIPTRIALPLLTKKKKTKIVSVHAGANHAFAIDSNGDTWAWGLNNFAQTGIPSGAGEDGSSIITPRKVKSLVGKNMKRIRGGSHHSIGVTWSGERLVWGRIDGAQMGLDMSNLPLDDPDKVIVERGKPRILLQPTPLTVSGCVYAAAGSDHSIVVTSDGKAYSWGFNSNYQCGQGTDEDIPIATLIDNSAVRNKRLSWAGAGVQYSMLAAPFEDDVDVRPLAT